VPEPDSKDPVLTLSDNVVTHRTDEQYQAIERIINDEFEGEIEKVEDAVLYLARRR
jgi:hypothetical protein